MSSDVTVKDLLHYDPSFIAAIIFSIGYGASAIIHDMQYRATKPQKFTLPLQLGAIFSTIGYISRALLIRNVGSAKTMYLISSMFVLGAGPTYAAADYFICGRLFSYIPAAAPWTPLRTVRTYIFFDFLAEICVWVGAAQLAGASGSIASGSTSSSTRLNVGLNLVRVAMIIQAALFISFIVLLGVFHTRYHKVQNEWHNNKRRRSTEKLLGMLYVSSVLLVVRAVYHIIETFVSDTHAMRSHEWPFLVFEAGLMLINTLMFNVQHPAHLLPRASTTFLDYLGQERESPNADSAWKDPRPWLWKVCDPLDFRGLVREKRGHTTNDEELEIPLKAPRHV